MNVVFCVRKSISVLYGMNDTSCMETIDRAHIILVIQKITTVGSKTLKSLLSSE